MYTHTYTHVYITLGRESNFVSRSSKPNTVLHTAAANTRLVSPVPIKHVIELHLIEHKHLISFFFICRKNPVPNTWMQ
jgi:hypothetical protein